MKFEENDWLPKCNSIRYLGTGAPEVWFRIVHVALDGHKGAAGEKLREQTVEIALGPKEAFVGTQARRVAADRVVSAALPHRGKPPKEPRPPRVVDLLRKAIEWRNLIESGDVSNQANIARREGITRARVTQLMSLVRLAPEIRDHILRMPGVARRPAITERALRPIVQIDNFQEQLRRFQELCL